MAAHPGTYIFFHFPARIPIHVCLQHVQIVVIRQLTQNISTKMENMDLGYNEFKCNHGDGYNNNNWKTQTVLVNLHKNSSTQYKVLLQKELLKLAGNLDATAVGSVSKHANVIECKYSTSPSIY